MPTFVSSPFLVARTDLLLTVPLGLAAEAGRHVKLTWAPLPAELTVEHRQVIMVWHERVEQDAGHRWLRALVVEAVEKIKLEMKTPRPT